MVFIPDWINFPSSEIIAIRCCITLFGRSVNKRSNLNELKYDVKCCEIEEENFQATCLTLLDRDIRLGHVETRATYFTSREAPGTTKAVLTNQSELSESGCGD